MESSYRLISETMKRYVAVKADAAMDPDACDMHVRAGVEMRRNLARAEVERLARDIRGLVEEDSAAIILTGPPANQAAFAAIAEDDGGAVCVSATELYEEVAKFIEPHLRSRAFGTEAGAAMQQALTQLAVRFQVQSYVMPYVHQYFGNAVADTTVLVDIVRKLIRGADGDEFNALYISHKVFEHVIATEYESDAVTVVVTGASAEEIDGLAAALFSRHTLTVEVKDPPEQNDIVLVARRLKPFFQRAETVRAAKNAAKARAAKAEKKASADAAPADKEAINPEA